MAARAPIGGLHHESHERSGGRRSSGNGAGPTNLCAVSSCLLVCRRFRLEGSKHWRSLACCLVSGNLSGKERLYSL